MGDQNPEKRGAAVPAPGIYVVGQYLGTEPLEAYDSKGARVQPVAIRIVQGTEMVSVEYKSKEDAARIVNGAQLLSSVTCRVRIQANKFGRVFYRGAS